MVLNFSQTWALYCLVQFYYITHEDLREIKPLSKFVCFKSIVFATWWQGVFLACFFSSPLAKAWLSPSAISGGNLQTSLQDFLICIEVCPSNLLNGRQYAFHIAFDADYCDSDSGQSDQIASLLSCGFGLRRWQLHQLHIYTYFLLHHIMI